MLGHVQGQLPVKWYFRSKHGISSFVRMMGYSIDHIEHQQ
jgi:hypothetical protein